MKIRNLALVSIFFSLLFQRIVADDAIRSYEEVLVLLPSKHAHAIESAKENTLESHLAVFLHLQDKYEILGVLRTNSSWFVISRIRRTSNIILSCGGPGGSSFRKTGFGKPSGYHLVRSISENRSTLEYNIGEEYKADSDTLTISCDGRELTISSKREPVEIGDSNNSKSEQAAPSNR